MGKNEVIQNQEVSSTFSKFAAKGTRNSQEKLPDLERKSISPQPRGEHLTSAMSINAYSRQQLENLQLDHKEK